MDTTARGRCSGQYQSISSNCSTLGPDYVNRLQNSLTMTWTQNSGFGRTPAQRLRRATEGKAYAPYKRCCTLAKRYCRLHDQEEKRKLCKERRQVPGAFHEPVSLYTEAEPQPQKGTGGEGVCAYCEPPALCILPVLANRKIWD